MVAMETVARRLTAQTIERRAGILQIEFQMKHGIIQAPPVPVDEILEVYLKFHLESDDLSGRHGLDHTDAFTDTAAKTVVVDQRLDPIEHPEMNGRYRFTLAHEIGHLRLHPRNPDFHRQFGTSNPRLVGSYQEFEWQADTFAACLLMPRYLVEREWVAHYDSGAIAVTPEMEAAGIANLGSRREFINAFAEHKAAPLAARFGVSLAAMRIRLQELSLAPSA
jgi:hypothetical protein